MSNAARGVCDVGDTECAAACHWHTPVQMPGPRASLGDLRSADAASDTHERGQPFMPLSAHADSEVIVQFLDKSAADAAVRSSQTRRFQVQNAILTFEKYATHEGALPTLATPWPVALSASTPLHTIGALPTCCHFTCCSSPIPSFPAGEVNALRPGQIASYDGGSQATSQPTSQAGGVQQATDALADATLGAVDDPVPEPMPEPFPEPFPEPYPEAYPETDPEALLFSGAASHGGTTPAHMSHGSHGEVYQQGHASMGGDAPGFKSAAPPPQPQPPQPRAPVDSGPLHSVDTFHCPITHELFQARSPISQASIALSPPGCAVPDGSAFQTVSHLLHVFYSKKSALCHAAEFALKSRLAHCVNSNGTAATAGPCLCARRPRVRA